MIDENDILKIHEEGDDNAILESMISDECPACLSKVGHKCIACSLREAKEQSLVGLKESIRGEVTPKQLAKAQASDADSDDDSSDETLSF